MAATQFCAPARSFRIPGPPADAQAHGLAVREGPCRTRRCDGAGPVAFGRDLTLAGLGIPLAAAENLPAESRLVLTSAEQAKGLEFEACIVLGLEDVERSMLNFAKNRAYVALSRPTRRLFMLCETGQQAVVDFFGDPLTVEARTLRRPGRPRSGGSPPRCHRLPCGTPPAPSSGGRCCAPPQVSPGRCPIAA